MIEEIKALQISGCPAKSKLSNLKNIAPRNEVASNIASMTSCSVVLMRRLDITSSLMR